MSGSLDCLLGCQSGTNQHPTARIWLGNHQPMWRQSIAHCKWSCTLGMVNSAGAEPLPHEVLCVSCGYNVQGLSAAAACPECGAPISRALAGDCLAFADRGWLNRVSRGLWFAAFGARWCTIALILMIVLPLCLSLLKWVPGVTWQSRFFAYFP